MLLKFPHIEPVMNIRPFCLLLLLANLTTAALAGAVSKEKTS
jgi:hypothetical protein